MERESMEFDVVIVGAGPCGPLLLHVKLMQLAQEKEQELMVCVVEKGSQKLAHIFCQVPFLKPSAMDELVPGLERKRCSTEHTCHG